MRKYNVAVVGVGAVGEEMLRVLRQRKFPINELRVFARSNREVVFDDQKYNVQKISADAFEGIDIALFAGTEGEKGAAVTYSPDAIKSGAVVIDNGADFRLKKGVPLVVPEVNPEDVKKHRGLIANPNCSTIQFVVALWPIYQAAGLKRAIACSYQAVSGAGRGGLRQLESETRAEQVIEPAFSSQISRNVIPHIGGFGKCDYTSEEWKMVDETHKIMHDKNIRISATCVRVPVAIGHSEAVYLETKRNITVKRIKQLLGKSSGIKVIDQPESGAYPLPIDAAGTDDVFVGRIRKDPFVKNGFWLWIVADNLRKGAALNAVQIAELVCATLK
ncbi:aspartate-semialdehyde dehydrogenase [Candidatus Omnitrophota bacterium]